MQHKIHRREVSEIPIKTTLSLHVVLSEEWTKQDINELLDNLYESEAETVITKSKISNFHIFIYLYSSEDRADANQGLWIAMLSKVGAEGEIYKSFDDEGIINMNTPEEIHFDLTELERREVWKKIVIAERNAVKKADESYPLDASTSEQIGQSYILEKQTPLVPSPEVGGLAGQSEGVIEKAIPLPPKTQISVIQTRKNMTKNWYLVNARTNEGDFIGKGWINGIALIGQTYMSSLGQLESHENLKHHLQDFFDKKISLEYELSQEQLHLIAVEGLTKKWPFPNSD